MKTLRYLMIMGDLQQEKKYYKMKPTSQEDITFFYISELNMLNIIRIKRSLLRTGYYRLQISIITTAVDISPSAHLELLCLFKVGRSIHSA